MALDAEWDDFMINGDNTDYTNENVFPSKSFKPEFTDIYISTQTKIGFLDSAVDLEEIFWKLPIIDYKDAKTGIIKKIIKSNSQTEKEVVKLEENIKNQKNVSYDIINQINTQTGDVKKFKDIRKIICGISKKDLINFRKKKKSAFYNCFAVIIRIKYNNIFNEINIKLFNTGKLEIPGIQNIKTLNIAVEILLDTIENATGKRYKYLKNKVETVLINSNFSCNFFIVRNKLYNILKFKYNIHSLFDPCSYPGIQCKFFYNKENEENDGTCKCEKKCNLNKKNKKINKCKIISFMVFRTGSILIVGNCDEDIIHIIYNFIVGILKKELFNDIITKKMDNKKKKIKKYRKRIIKFTNL
jgi:TATA-box binding protein (TBP) (component of TFIID and TFIIIB)